ncbi:MAG: hypothetical protein EAZ95_11005 [Bacteroidetes bacterium]|nr:MAG: hypothetical protein EAZ95_11005 [Bacteroidota bacterium]
MRFFPLLLLWHFSIYGAYAQKQDTLASHLWEVPVDDILRMPMDVSGWQDVKIVTASRSEEVSGKAPAMIRVVTEEQIRTRCYRSLLDVLRDLPDFKVDDGTMEQINNLISIRGIVDVPRFVILLNGMRITSPTNESVPILENFPVHIAKQIEVMYGAGSALYGADAMAGVINIITKENPKENIYEITPTVGMYGMSNVSFFTNTKINNEAILSVSGAYHHDVGADLSRFYPDKFDMQGHTTGTFNTIFGPQASKTPVTPRYEMPILAYNLHASLRLKDFSFQIFRNYGQVSNSTSVSPQNTVYNKDSFYGSNILAGSINHQKNFEKISFTSQILGSKYELNPNSNYRNVYTALNYGYKYALGQMLKLEEQITWRIHNKLTLIGGVTYETFASVPKTADLPTPIDRTKALENTYIGTDIPMKFFTTTYYNTGGFLQFQYTPSQILSVTIGSRYDYNSRFGATFNPRLGLVLQPTNKTIIKALFGSAFLAPSPEVTFEHYGSFFSTGGNNYASFFWHLPNPTLKPIYARNAELGLRQLVGKNLSINFNVYHTWLDNLYRRVSDSETLNLYNGKFLTSPYPINFIEITINQGRQRNYGGTLQLDFRQEWSKEVRLEAYFAVSYLQGKTEVTNNNESKFVQAGMITPWQLKTGVDMYFKRFTASPRLVWVGKQYLSYFWKDSPDSRQSLAGFALLNVALRFNIYKQNFIFINIQNALNNRYVGAGTSTNLDDAYFLQGVPQQPIRLSGGAQFKF